MKVIYTAEARDSLDGILAFIASDLRIIYSMQ
jgi:hypothetical protein